MKQNVPYRTDTITIQEGQDVEDMIDSLFEAARRNINCFENINSFKYDDQKGPITLKIEIDSIYHSGSSHKKSYSKSIEIDKQSGMIYLDSTVALIIFHIEANEYGILNHLIRFDFYLNNGHCWERKYNGQYDAIYIGSSLGEFSIGYPNTLDYFKVSWGLYRIK